MKKFLQSFCLGFLLPYTFYIISYLPLRKSLKAAPDEQGNPCIVFPREYQTIYAIYLPAMWLDTRVTGTRFKLERPVILEGDRTLQ